MQFAFTITYHYLFPQLTMGLAWFLVYWKWRALRTGEERYNRAVRFWAKIFGLNFAVGVVTGIPMEFQFGTNWARFSEYSGGVIGQTPMEHVRLFWRARLWVRSCLARNAWASAITFWLRSGLP
jgi:cytochrome bd-type quinol oxidase subunit 1